MNITVDELISRKSEKNVIDDPILFMMDKTDHSKIRQNLQYLDFIMHEMIELEELVKTARSREDK